MDSKFLHTAGNWLIQAGVGGAALLGLVLLALYLGQNAMLYQPIVQPLAKDQDENPEGYRNPGESGLPYENVIIKTKDGQTLHGWFVKQPNPTKVPTVVMFHENAGNIGTRIPYMSQYYNDAGTNVVLIAYRGYSKSTGQPTEEGLQIDGRAILEHVLARDDIDPKAVYVHGRSLGGAVSIYSVTSGDNGSRVAGVILENTFTSIGDMVDSIFPKLSWFKNLLLRNHWPSLSRIPKISAPILFIMSKKDELVPHEQMLRLRSAATNAAFIETHIIEMGTHNLNWSLDTTSYSTAIRGFLKKSAGQQGYKLLS